MTYNTGFIRNAHSVRRAAALTVAGIWLMLVAFTSPVIPKGDGSSMFAVAESIVNQRSIAVPPDLGSVGRGGLYYSPWYPLLSVVLVPFVTAGEVLARIVHMSQHYLAGSAALIFPGMLITANALITIALALRLGTTVEGALWSGLAFVFGTIALVNAREILADPLLALLTASAIYVALGDSGKLNTAAIGVISALAVLAKPTGLIVGPATAAFLLIRRRDIGATAAPLGGAVIGLVLYLGYNDYRFGDPLFFGQSAVFRLANVPVGVIGQLISPGHGLFWYCPAVLALVFLPRFVFWRSETWLVIGVAAAYLVSYSAWRVWDAGWSWGPRFMIAGLPGLMALTGFLDERGRRWLMTLTIAGVVIAAPTLVSNYQRVYVESAAAGITDQVRDWSITDAPITAAWGAAERTIRASLQSQNEVGVLVRQAGAEYHKTADEMPGLKVIALWWWMLPAAHIPAWIGALIALAMVVTGTILVAQGLRLARGIDDHSVWVEDHEDRSVGVEARRAAR
ncbi:MAG: hypothetical protein WBY93_21740 [Candidatus Binatus sp.]